MVFDSINQKSKEFKKDSAKEVYSDINVADIDISMLDDVDLNSLRDELDIINGAIEKGSIELPPDELTKFKKDFNLISNILNEKYNVEDNSLSEETKKYNVKFENKVDTVIDQNTSGNMNRNDELRLDFSYGEELGYDEYALIDFNITLILPIISVNLLISFLEIICSK